MDFIKALEKITEFLKGERVRFSLGGAIALNGYGLGRLTNDLDLIVDERVQPALLEFMVSLGYEQLRATEGYSNHLHREATWGRIDFIYLDPGTADQLFGRARPAKPLGDLEILLPAPEHLAAMKANAIKNNPARRLQDMADVQFLLGLPGVDESEIRSYFDKYGLQSLFDDIKKAMASA